MTVLFEMRIRVGGDPRGFGEFVALLDELGKMSHPACPDVDWAKVEQLCLALFQQNGADLQSAAAFALARSHLQGLEGMTQGVAVLEALVCEWLTLWPSASSTRLGILAWLFAQLQSLLRSLEVTTRSLPKLAHLGNELVRLRRCLDSKVQVPLVTFETLCRQTEMLMHRLERNGSSTGTLQQSTNVHESALWMPVVILPGRAMPEVKLKRRRIAGWLFPVVASFVLIIGVWWTAAGPDSDSVDRLAGLFQQEQTMPGPVRLKSLFNSGSAEFKPGSTKFLISALVDIKAKPGWLIVIAGHTDARGNAEQNLQLSHARAAAVRGWMQRMGDIPDSCFAIQGDASNQPIASNDTESGREANRRVEIHLVPQGGACGQPVNSLENGQLS